MKKLAVLSALVVFFFTTFSLPVGRAPVNADAGPVHLFGVNITPYEENNIRLEKENLSIDFKSSDDVYVDAKFVFVNEGDKISLKMGFPFGISRDKGNVIFPKDINVKIDGKSVETSYITTETSIYDPWVYFDTSFNKGETKTVEVSYRAVPLGGYFSYVLNTGALWKGPIGTLYIDIKFPITPAYPYLLNLKPQGYTIQGNEAIYHLTNFEPKEDIEIEFIPEDFFNKIKPLKDKAEKTHSAGDWFNYALSLLPQNPFMPYESLRDGGFVGGYVDDAFENYVLSVVKMAKGLQKEGSPEYKILEAIERARTDNFSQFELGLDVFNIGEDRNVTIDSILSLFEGDVDSPQNKTEGKMIAYILEYKVLASLEEYNSIQALSFLHKLLQLTDKYFDKNDYISVPYSSFAGMMAAQKLDTGAPFFMECFIPQVKIEGAKIYISYILPFSMQSALRNPYNNGIEVASDNIKPYFEKTSPYAYTVSVDFSSQNGLSNFDNARKLAIGSIKETSNREGDNFAYKFINIYFEDILNNLTVENGHIVPFKTSLDCTQKIQDALKKVEDESKTLQTYKSKVSDTNFEGMFIDSSLVILDYNRDFLNDALKMPKIEFSSVSPTQNNSTQNKNYAVIILSTAVVLLLLSLIFAILKINKMKKSPEDSPDDLKR